MTDQTDPANLTDMTNEADQVEPQWTDTVEETPHVKGEWTEVVEVILQPHDEGYYVCYIYSSKEEQVDVWFTDALGERGAQLEVTASLRDRGYEPGTRWAVDGDRGAFERKFRRQK